MFFMLEIDPGILLVFVLGHDDLFFTTEVEKNGKINQ
jgi:hypothetical protein